MAYLYASFSDAEAIRREALAEPPLGPGFSDSLVAQADRLEVWASEVKEPGEDWCEFRLFRGGTLLAQQRVPGC